MKKYKIGFDPFGLILFLTVMLPNFIWMIKPAPNDILRAESLTPILDSIMSAVQIIFVVSMCGIINKRAKKLHVSAWIMIAVISTVVYYVTWGFYYSGNISNTVVLHLTVAPCMAFIAYLIGRKNYIALLFAIFFLLCHLLHAILNFIV